MLISCCSCFCWSSVDYYFKPCAIQGCT